MKLLLFSLTMLVTLATASAAHNPLLPRPQEVHYENGSLPLRGLSIRLADSSKAEDHFAAELLASRLAAIGQKQIPIAERARERLGRACRQTPATLRLTA